MVAPLASPGVERTPAGSVGVRTAGHGAVSGRARAGVVAGQGGRPGVVLVRWEGRGALVRPLRGVMARGELRGGVSLPGGGDPGLLTDPRGSGVATLAHGGGRGDLRDLVQLLQCVVGRWRGLQDVVDVWLLFLADLSIPSQLAQLNLFIKRRSVWDGRELVVSSACITCVSR